MTCAITPVRCPILLVGGAQYGKTMGPDNAPADGVAMGDEAA
ncbi:hypothetical protein [Natronosporangium hydrolyticum]|nr:hypothetical protein [Natronosporangium hydrolyticum]